MKKDLSISLILLSISYHQKISFIWEEKWGDILKAAVCLVVISELGLFFFLSEAIISL